MRLRNIHLVAIALALTFGVVCQGVIQTNVYYDTYYADSDSGANTYVGLFNYPYGGRGYCECDAWVTAGTSSAETGFQYTPTRGQHWYTSGTGSETVYFEASGDATAMLHYAFTNYPYSTHAYGGGYCRANLYASCSDQNGSDDSGYAGDISMWWAVESDGGEEPEWYALGWYGYEDIEDWGRGPADRLDVPLIFTWGRLLSATGDDPAYGDFETYFAGSAYIDYPCTEPGGYIDSEAWAEDCDASMTVQ